MDISIIVIRSVIFLAIFLAVAITTRKQIFVVITWIIASLIYGVLRWGISTSGFASGVAVAVDPIGTVIPLIIALVVARPKKHPEKEDSPD